MANLGSKATGCNIVNTFGTTGTTNGFLITGPADFVIAACNIAGWTNGQRHAECGTVAYGCILIQNNALNGNTTALTNSATAPTATTAGNFRISGNAGLNPKGSVTTPTIASATLFTNTTMYAVTAYLKAGTTAPTVLTINGITAVFPLASQITPIALEPGGA
jgi:hypothetical protein